MINAKAARQLIEKVFETDKQRGALAQTVASEDVWILVIVGYLIYNDDVSFVRLKCGKNLRIPPFYGSMPMLQRQGNHYVITSLGYF